MEAISPTPADIVPFAQTPRVFDPSKYLTKVGGADYLEVKWRLVWLREVHPDAAVSTELVSYTEREAVVRAMVSIPDGGSATGYGSEQPGDFRDYLEKAETKALGRALAALGYGSQFCRDHEFGAREGRLADAPVTRPSGNGYRPSATSAAMGDGTISPKQLAFARQLVAKLGIDDATLADALQREYGVGDLADVGRSDASGLIDRLKAKADALAAGGR